jgi:hypothetical protein
MLLCEYDSINSNAASVDGAYKKIPKGKKISDE